MVAAETRLRPLRWVAEEELVYDEARNELHKPSCALSQDGVGLEAGEAIELVWAPQVCRRCRPGVTTALGL